MITNETNLFKIAEIEVKYSTSVKPAERLKVVTSGDAAEAFRELWSQSMEYKESFYAMYLNRNNKILGIHKVSEGGLSGTVVDIRCIFQVALKANACSVIVAHNHPSGNDAASEQDKTITRKIKDAGLILDIPLLDHLIMLPGDGYMSFADEALI
jgi:DNA repair protein RadC